MKKYEEYKILLKRESSDFGGNSVFVFIYISKVVYGIVVMCIFSILMYVGVVIEGVGKKIID